MSIFLPNQAELFDWKSTPEVIEPWEPHTLTADQWPPDYRAVYAWRMKMLKLLQASPELLASAKAYYSQPGIGRVKFICHWMDTYNPRKSENKWMPFVLFKRQEEFLLFLWELERDSESGLVEKCRDAGVTWLACAASVHSWIFNDHDAIGWGSRKQELVDRIGEPDSIFEKMRLLIERLPACFLPDNYDAPFMKILNHENGSVISGESGDNIGRGGRKRVYIKDESAHYERAEKIEAALGNNTNIQVDISSVNGLGNVFHRRREAGIDWHPGAVIKPGFTRVFVFDWRDHPEKTEEWYKQSREKHEREGLLHVFAQEVERNYAASVQNVLIELDWIKAATDAHIAIPEIATWDEEWSAGADIADEGMDVNALVKKQGLVMRYARHWGERDPGVAARFIIDDCREHKGIKVQYDAIGVGSAVKSEYNRLMDDDVIKFGDIFMIPWLAGDSVQFPYNNIILGDEKSPTNFDFFHNMKAQAWWSLRTRFYKTWRAIKLGVKYHPSELISIDSTIPVLRQLEKELAQPTYGKSSSLKMLINKKPDGTKSPNIADAMVMCYFPSMIDYATVATGTHANV